MQYSYPYTLLEGDSSVMEHTWIQKAKQLLGSRYTWRIILALELILVSANLFHSRSLLSGLAHGHFVHDSLQDDVPANVDWSRYAYAQYVTNEQYLCNSVMIFESLHRVGAKASKVMMYPSHWNITGDSQKGKLIRQARDTYGVQLSPIHVQHLPGDTTWADSFTKLLAFNQTQFQRVLSLDSDATVLQDMDELFFLPSSPVAVPRAYWLDHKLATHLVLVEPSEFEFERVVKAFANRADDEYDMEIVNRLYGEDCGIIPHRKYALLTGEFRSDSHRKYLGSEEEVWDPERVLEEAKYVHFSDWPLPKPWMPHSKTQEEELQPECHPTSEGEDCRDRDIWLGLYADFRRRRDLCYGST